MPLTTAQVVRSRINCPYIYDTEVIYGDGSGSAYKLKQGAPFSTISATATASVLVAGGWSATGATFDYSLGRVVFATALWPNSAVQIDYQWSVFGELEMDYFISASNSGILQASLLAVQHMLVDAAKQASWGAPDGSNLDPKQIFNNLKALESGLVNEIRGSELGPIGDVNSWAETQGDFWY